MIIVFEVSVVTFFHIYRSACRSFASPSYVPCTNHDITRVPVLISLRISMIWCDSHRLERDPLHEWGFIQCFTTHKTRRWPCGCSRWSIESTSRWAVGGVGCRLLNLIESKSQSQSCPERGRAWTPMDGERLYHCTCMIVSIMVLRRHIIW